MDIEYKHFRTWIILSYAPKFNPVTESVGLLERHYSKKGKAIPLTGCEGP
jgi:hypothetical protein